MSKEAGFENGGAGPQLQVIEGLKVPTTGILAVEALVVNERVYERLSDRPVKIVDGPVSDPFTPSSHDGGQPPHLRLVTTPIAAEKEDGWLEKLRADLEELASDNPMPIERQLDIADRFWSEVTGLHRPPLSQLQKRIINLKGPGGDLAIFVRDGERIFPTPALSAEEKIQALKRARELFPGAEDDAIDSSPKLADEKSLYGQLWRNPESIAVISGLLKSKSYGIRYMTPRGNYHSKPEFSQIMISTGLASLGDDNRPWYLPVVNMRPAATESDESAGVLFRRKADTLLPESLLGIHLIHEIIGNVPTSPQMNIANEALCDLSAIKNRKWGPELILVTGVGRIPSDQAPDDDRVSSSKAVVIHMPLADRKSHNIHEIAA